MSKGLPSVLVLCFVVVLPQEVLAQSATLPAPRGILRDAAEPVDLPRVESPAVDMPQSAARPAPVTRTKPEDAVRLAAQQEPALPAPKVFPAPSNPIPQSYDTPAIDWSGKHDDPSGCRFWVRPDFLLWNVRKAPMPSALVTVGDPLDPLPGALGQAGTRTLFGGSDIGFGAVPGMRLSAGIWCNSERNIGLEGSAFVLQQRSNTFNAASDLTGHPVLAFPFFNQTPGAAGESALQISNPSPFLGLPLSGSVAINSTMQLWGAEMNGVFCLWSKPGFEWLLLGGFRYADLRETLNIYNATSDFSTTPVTSWALNDNFNTRNQFYGGQLGTRLNFQHDRFSVDTALKVALGVNHEVVDINGNLTQTGSNPLSLPYGFFTEPSNIGRRTSNQFTVMPSSEIRIGYQLTKCVRLSIGYDFMYWNQVVRPGNQIDRNINLSQNAASFAGGGTLTGPVYPQPLFNRTDFVAQGVSFGMEISY